MESNISLINESRRESSITSDKQKKPLITCAKLNKYFLIPFIAPVFNMFSNYFIFKVGEQKVVKHEEFIITSIIMITYIVAGCLYFISKLRQKVEGAKEKIIYNEPNSSPIKYIYNEGIKTNVLKELILIIFIAFLISLTELLSSFSNKPKYNLFPERLYFILFIPLFSKFILKENIFRHHYFSLLIALAGFVLLFVPVCFKIVVDDILPNVLKFINVVSYSLFLVLIKYLTHVYYISPFKLSLIFGTIALGFIFFGF